MKCRKCKKREAVGEFCRSCYIEIFEKRVRKHIRLNKIVARGDTVLARDALSFHLLKSLQSVIVHNRKTLKRYDHVFAAYSMDSVSGDFLGQLIDGKKPKLRSVSTILTPVTNDEITLYCKYKNIKPPTLKENRLLRDMEDRFPGTVRAFSHAIE